MLRRTTQLLVTVALLTVGRLPAVAASPTEQSHEGMAMDHRVPQSLADWAHDAKLFTGLGTFHRAITTDSPEAQRYFDQGMRLLWAFNHDESTRSFARALELDPRCAMCAWGVALTVGPNYNLPVLAAPRAKIAFDTEQRALSLAPATTPVEQALIAALARRYPNAQPLDAKTMNPVLVEYAAAMRDVASRFPADLDVQTLYAESMMNINAWRLWSLDGEPADGTEAILATLESVIARDPMHMGALHYYIHAVEASPHPEKAVPAAERLRGLATAAGHLEHMPAHILQRVGRYEEAADANRKGAAADLAYLAQTTAPDYYPMYLGHNYQFLAYSAGMEGRKAEAIDSLRRSRAGISDALLKEMPGVDWNVAGLYAALVRFGEWDLILAEPAPNPDLPGLAGGYWFATTVALAAKGRLDAARDGLAQLKQVSAGLPAGRAAGNNTLADVLSVGERVAAARIAAAEGRGDDAIALLREAVDREDRLAYDEPADWYTPARHQLGAELLRQGRPGDAELVLREDLERHPHNGWALCGLAAAQRAGGHAQDGAATEAEFRQAWQRADVSITSSAF